MIKKHKNCNDGKSVVAKEFIRTFLKFSKHMTAVSKNVYFGVLDDIVDNYNSPYHWSVKVKPIDLKLDSLVNIMLVILEKILNFI